MFNLLVLGIQTSNLTKHSENIEVDNWGLFDFQNKSDWYMNTFRYTLILLTFDDQLTVITHRINNKNYYKFQITKFTLNRCKEYYLEQTSYGNKSTLYWTKYHTKYKADITLSNYHIELKLGIMLKEIQIRNLAYLSCHIKIIPQNVSFYLSANGCQRFWNAIMAKYALI